MSEQCVYVEMAPTWLDRAVYCEDEAQDDSEYCPLHDPDNWQPDWDDMRKDRIYDCE